MPVHPLTHLGEKPGIKDGLNCFVCSIYTVVFTHGVASANAQVAIPRPTSKGRGRKRFFCGVLSGDLPLNTPPAGQTIDFRIFPCKDSAYHHLKEVPVSKYYPVRSTIWNIPGSILVRLQIVSQNPGITPSHKTLGLLHPTKPWNYSMKLTQAAMVDKS